MDSDSGGRDLPVGHTATLSDADPPRPPFPFYPFLVAVFPVLSLYSINMGVVRATEMLPLVAVMLGVCGVVFGLAVALSRSVRASALAAFLFLFPFVGYGAVIDTLREVLRGGGTVVYGQAACLCIGGLVWLVCCAATWRYRQGLTLITRLLNNVSVCLILVPMIIVGNNLYQQHKYGVEHGEIDTGRPPSSEELLQYPDVYYIVPDSYGHAGVIEEFIGYDNTPFVDALRERGFYIGERSRSNYPRTQMSLASTMNMDYLEPELVMKGEWKQNLPIFSQKIWVNRVMQIFADRGYELPTFTSKVAASEIQQGKYLTKPNTFLLTEFQERFLNKTPLRVPLNRLTANQQTNRTLYVLDELAKIRRRDRPMFVMLHIMSPHLPHEFDADCQSLAAPPPYDEGYAGELQCINRHFLSLIDAILARQPNSVFVIQGDHGPRTDWRSVDSSERTPWEGTWEEWVRNYLGILNVYYFPDRDYSMLFPEVMPVNTFRIIFDKYFGTSYGILTQQSYLKKQFSDEVITVTEVF